MNITRSNIRSVVLHVLLLIFLAIVQTKADEMEGATQLGQFEHFPNVLNLDSIELPSLNDIDIEGLSTELFQPILYTTTTTTTVTTTKKLHSIGSGTTFATLDPIADNPEEGWYDAALSATVEIDDISGDRIRETYSYSSSDSSPTIETFFTPTATLPSSVHAATPSVLINTTISNTTIQYTNTSDPLVQYDLECKADDVFCSKVSRAVGAAIDEFTRVINVKNSLLQVYYIIYKYMH